MLLIHKIKSLLYYIFFFAKINKNRARKYISQKSRAYWKWSELRIALPLCAITTDIMNEPRSRTYRRLSRDFRFQRTRVSTKCYIVMFFGLFRWFVVDCWLANNFVQFAIDSNCCVKYPLNFFLLFDITNNIYTYISCIREVVEVDHYRNYSRNIWYRQQQNQVWK